MYEMIGIVYVAVCILIFYILNRLVMKKEVPSVKKLPIPSNDERNQVTENYHLGKVLTVLMLGMFFSLLNQTVINVALPVLINELNVATTTAQWLSTGFMLINGILVPISAYLIDRFTYRHLFFSAMGFFIVGSFICAIAVNFPIMMIGRGVQAVGAGILMPLGSNIFMTVFPPEKRGTAMGVMGVAMILAPAIGPTIAGYIIQNYNWHLIFYGMAGIGVLTLLLAYAWFHISRERKFPPLDVWGIVTSSIGLASILYGFSEAGSSGWGSSEVIVSLVVGIVFIVFFVIRELTTATPLLDLRVFKNFNFTYTLLINFIVTIALYGGMILLPLYLQTIRGFTPIQSGLMMLPGSLIMGIMGTVTGRLYDKYGVRPLAIIGLFIMTISTYEFTKLSMDTPYSYLVLMYALRGFGMSFIMMPIMTAGYSKLSGKMISHGIATQNTVRQLAGSVGTAILITIMTHQTTQYMADYTNTVTVTNATTMNWIQHITQVLVHTKGMSQEAANAVAVKVLYGQTSKFSAISGINDAFLIATILAGLALFLSFFIGGVMVQQIKKRKKIVQEYKEEGISA